MVELEEIRVPFRKVLHTSDTFSKHFIFGSQTKNLMILNESKVLSHVSLSDIATHHGRGRSSSRTNVSLSDIATQHGRGRSSSRTNVSLSDIATQHGRGRSSSRTNVSFSDIATRHGRGRSSSRTNVPWAEKGQGSELVPNEHYFTKVIACLK